MKSVDEYIKLAKDSNNALDIIENALNDRSLSDDDILKLIGILEYLQAGISKGREMFGQDYLGENMKKFEEIYQQNKEKSSKKLKEFELERCAGCGKRFISRSGLDILCSKCDPGKKERAKFAYRDKSTPLARAINKEHNNAVEQNYIEKYGHPYGRVKESWVKDSDYRDESTGIYDSESQFRYSIDRFKDMTEDTLNIIDDMPEQDLEPHKSADEYLQYHFDVAVERWKGHKKDRD